MPLEALLSKRQSIRAFSPQKVTEQEVRDILEKANMSPSGGNTQPCKTYVLSGESKNDFVASVTDQIKMGKTQDETGASSYPDKLKSPYRERRYECGMALYSALDIGKEDRAKRYEQWQYNYQFFNAPVGMLFVMDKQMIKPQFIDLGIYIQTIMLAAQEAGLATCAQGSWGAWPETVSKALGLDDNEQVVMGMALGYADMEHPVNQYRTSRDTVDDVAVFSGF